MKRDFTANVWQEAPHFIAQCREVEVASQGATEAEALEMLADALALHFSCVVATDLPQLRSLQVDVPAA